MSPLLQACACGALVTQKPCPDCAQADNRRRNQKPKRKQWSTAAYRQARKHVLHRDSHTCKLNYPGCLRQADQVHHGDYGLHELDKWKAVCSRCHGKHDGRLGGGAHW